MRPPFSRLQVTHPPACLDEAYFSGVWQSGKKVLATIFAVCPLVALALGRKYGLFSGGTHGSSGNWPH